jgi:hypothetical protein
MFTTQEYPVHQRVAQSMLIALLLASTQTTAVFAEDKVGEAAIDAAYDQPAPDAAVAAPIVTEQVAAHPVAAEPVTVESSAAAPVAAEQVAAAPVAAAPVAAEQVAAAPVAVDQVAAAPVAAEVIASEPVPAAPAVAEQGAVQSASGAAPSGAAGGISGQSFVDGGSVVNQTDVSLSANGGTAIADASGGDDNIAVGAGNGEVAAGNGGWAEADASGGAIVVGNINSGNNTGNTIAVGAPSVPVAGGGDGDHEPNKGRKIQLPNGTPVKHTATGTGISRPAAPGRVRARGGRTTRVIARRARTARVAPRRTTRAERIATRRARRAVGAVPSTGTGTSSMAIAGSQTGTWFLIGGLAMVGAVSLRRPQVQRRLARRPVAIRRSLR